MKPLIAFYAPIKPPDHAIASGDREISRLMVKALEMAGFEVEIASRTIAYQKRPSSELFEERKRDALAELSKLKRDWQARPLSRRPALWFTYHPYCKAPDWLGPALAEEFSIPYVTAEACRTRQASDNDWTEARQQVQSAACAAAINFCLKQSDRDYLESFLADRSSIVALPPFVDIAELDTMARLPDKKPNSPLLVAAGMMRPGAKTSSYLALAEALKLIAGRDWNLVIIGDGPTWPQIEAAFEWASRGRIRWTGAIARGEVLGWFREGDVLVWPGIREAIGLVFMEAQSQELPVVAFHTLGVPLVVKNGTSGLLVPEGEIAAFAGAIAQLLENRDMRTQMGARARSYVAQNHDIAGAAATFQATLGPLIDKR